MTINCKGNLIDLSTPKVMGILNVTPDSFYDGGQYTTEATFLARTEQLLKEGATFIDLGGHSSRPGAKEVGEDEELRRILPALERLLHNFPEALVAIETFRSAVAAACLERGAALINDITGGLADARMLPTIARYRVPYIIMHMRGTPQTMQERVEYQDLMGEILLYCSERVAMARTYGLTDIVLDPGFGFAKTLEQNYELLQHLNLLQFFELPILVGLSRKSMIYRKLETSAEHALNGSTALHSYALAKGARILRTHDVKEALECIRLYEELA